MSLQIWLPLNGNLNNQGLTPISLNSGTATYTDNGKLGKCLNTGTLIFNVTNNLITNIGNTKKYSMCCWCRNLLTSAADRWVFFIGAGTGTSRGLWETNSTNTRHWAYAGSGQNISSINVVNTNWYHIVFTVNGTTVKLYINGIYQNQITNASTTALTINTFQLNATNYNLQDFRLYDHCLSNKEVEEIAKGLFMHFKCDNIYEGSLTNRINYPESYGNLITSNYTKTILSNEIGYNFKTTFTGTSANTYYWINSSNFTFTPGATYKWSCEVRCNSISSNAYVRFRAARVNNDYASGNISIVVANSSLADGQWHKYELTQTIPSSVTYLDNSTATSNPRVEFYTNNMNTSGANYSIDIDIKNIQVTYIISLPFINNNFRTSTMYDTSGYGYNGITSNRPDLNTNTPRYSLNFAANDSRTLTINIPALAYILATGKQYTLACWVKPTGLNNTGWVIKLGDNTCGLWWAKSSARWVWNENDNGRRCANTTISEDYNNWHHLVTTVNKTTASAFVTKHYVDGVPATGYETYTWDNGSNVAPTGTNIVVNFGNSYLSDIRLYATILTADQIKELYNTSMSIDNQGNIFVRELVE